MDEIANYHAYTTWSEAAALGQLGTVRGSSRPTGSSIWAPESPRLNVSLIPPEITSIEFVGRVGSPESLALHRYPRLPLRLIWVSAKSIPVFGGLPGEGLCCSG